METNNPPQNNIPQVPHKSGIGSIIGTIIIIAIIILGGLYFWGKRVEEAKLKQDLVSDGTPQTSQTTQQSDDLNTIEAELNSTTELDTLGSELDS